MTHTVTPLLSHVALPFSGTDYTDAATNSGTSTLSPDVIEVTLKVEPTTNLAYYQLRVTALCKQTRQSLIELAELLDEARRNLTRAEFKILREQNHLAGAELSILKGLLKFHRDLKPEYSSKLPENMYTQYQISLLNHEALSAAISSGLIHPQCTAKQVRSYRKCLETKKASVTDVPFLGNATRVGANTTETAAADCAANAANTDNADQNQPSTENQETVADTGDVSGVRLDSYEPNILGKFTIPTSMVGSRPALAVERIVSQLNHMSNLKILVDYV